MKVYLFNANLVSNECLEGATSIIDGLVQDPRNLQVELRSGLGDADLLICDLEFLSTGMSEALRKEQHHILSRVQSGAVLLCFQAAPRNGNYDWLANMGMQLNAERLEGDTVIFAPSSKFAKLKGTENDYYYRAIFNSLPVDSSPLYYSKSEKYVGVYRKFDKGYVFVLPRPNDKAHFLKKFIQEILPVLEVNFLIKTGSIEPMPEAVRELVVPGQEILESQIRIANEKIKATQDMRDSYEEAFEKLERWKDLLWETGEPLEQIVKRFFEEYFDLELRKEDTDLVGEFKGREVFIEVKGKVKEIDHKSDFRQIQERKTYVAEDPVTAVALLVGNPFRLNELKERPPQDMSLFAKTSIPIAEQMKIGLVHTLELYKIVEDICSGKKVNKDKVLETLFNTAGVYKYETMRVKKP
jgi:hypothetical protein